MYRPPSSPQEKSENAVNQSKILLRFFLRRGEVCTQATRRSLGLSPIGSTQIFSSKLPVSLTEKQNIFLVMILVSLDFSILYIYIYIYISCIIMAQRSPGNRPTVACSQTLYFLFRDRRARVLTQKPPGIY